MNTHVTFLQLAAEFGGTKFGPFTSAEVRLGSDPGNSDITLPETLGVAGQHMKLLRQQDNSFIIAPVDRTAPVFFFRAGQARSKQVTSPLAVQSGDSFALVTPEGPRFVIVVETDPRAVKAAAEEASGPGFGAFAGKMTPSAGKMSRGLAAEIKRRGVAAVFTTRLGNLWMRTWTMVKSGAIFSPIYIVSGMMILSGWLFAGGSSCSAYKLNASRMELAGQVSSCRDQLGVAQGQDGSELTDPTVPDLTRIVLGHPEWKNTIENDDDLYAAYTAGLKEVYEEGAKYRWVYTKKGEPWKRFDAALEAVGMPKELARVVSYAAATTSSQRLWTLVNDSEEKEVCGRGPLSLTYRAATNLGLTVQPDALADPQLADSNDVNKQRELLDATLREASAVYEYRNDLITKEGAEVQGGLACLYVDGTDDRTDYGALAAAINRRIGTSARKVPKIDGQHGIAARILWLYAQEFKAYQLESIDLDTSTAPSRALATQNVKESRLKYAVREAGRMMGRAAAIPCLARFDKEQREVPEWFMKDPPKVGSCAILRAYVEFDRR